MTATWVQVVFVLIGLSSVCANIGLWFQSRRMDAISSRLDDHYQDILHLQRQASLTSGK